MNRTSSTSFASIRENEKERLLGFLFWLILVFVGSGIIFYLFVINPGGDNYSDNSVPGVGFSQKTQHREPAQILRKRKNWITYDGILETNVSIQFKMSGYDSAAKYFFDFGDGTTKKCRSSRISHAYSKPGKYTVKVKVKYDNKVTEAWTDTLIIKKGIPVDPAAFE